MTLTVGEHELHRQRGGDACSDEADAQGEPQDLARLTRRWARYHVSPLEERLCHAEHHVVGHHLDTRSSAGVGVGGGDDPTTRGRQPTDVDDLDSG